MSLVKNIAGETAVYGLSSIIGRAVNFLLVPLYTFVLAESAYGNVSELYAYVGFLMVLMVYRFETAFFRFGTEKGKLESSYSTALSSLLGSTILITAGITLFAPELTALLKYSPEESIYIRFFAWVLFFDVLAEIPLARLRLENKAWRFAFVRLTNIALNIGFNLFFLLLCPWIAEGEGLSFLKSSVDSFHNPDFKVGYVFLSNLIASAVMLMLLIPELSKVRIGIDTKLWKKMIKYALPLVIVGLAGIANEMLDRILLKWLLPYDLETNEAQLGIYSACYKLAMLMALFTQAYRYAAEPFFFKHRKHGQSAELYGVIAKYFVIAGVLGFLVITLFIDYFQLFLRQPEYWTGIHVVPILLVANLMLGLYYNLSVWYKLSDKTMLAAYISSGGALITIVLNIWWIPLIGYLGSAWATLITYTVMTIASYFIGLRYYPLQIDWKRILLYVGLGAGIFLVDQQLIATLTGSTAIINLIHLLEISMFILLTHLLEYKSLRYWLGVK